MSIFTELLRDPILFDIVVALPFVLAGSIILVFSKMRFGIPIGHVGVSLIRRDRTYKEGWYWGLPPRDCSLVKIDTFTVKVPANDKDEDFEIETPDNGILGAKVTVVYSPDDSKNESLLAYSRSNKLDEVLSSRIQSALKSWAWQKPFPGTARRAVANKADAEKAIISKLTGVPSEALAFFGDTEWLYSYSISDLGIVIREVHLTDFWEITRVPINRIGAMTICFLMLKKYV